MNPDMGNGHRLFVPSALKEKADDIVAVHMRTICTKIYKEKQNGTFTAEFAVWVKQNNPC